MKSFLAALFGVPYLILTDPTITCFAVMSVGIAILAHSIILGVVVFYGAYAIARTVTAIANAIGNGLAGHAQRIAQAIQLAGMHRDSDH